MDFSLLFFTNIESQAKKSVNWQKVYQFCQSYKMKRPPNFGETRWNSIVYCIQFVYDNYETIKSALSYFKSRKEALKIKYCPKNDYLEVLNVVLPISIFSCKVESNFCTTGDVFKELITLKEKINELIRSRSKLAEVVLSQINYRFSSMCDSSLAELSFLLTQEGKTWLNAQIAENDRILAKLTNRLKLD